MQGNEGRDKRKVPQMTGMTVSATLNKAADYLQTHGWMQGAFGVPGGPRCLVGALISAEQRNTWCPSGEDEVGLYLCGRDDYHGSVPDWNDAEGRTAEEVIATLRAAALVAAANESQPSVEAVRP